MVAPEALAKFAARLPASTLVVQYFAAADRLYLFVVAPDNRFAVKSRAVTRQALYGLVKDYRRYLEAEATQRLPWTGDGSPEYYLDRGSSRHSLLRSATPCPCSTYHTR